MANRDALRPPATGDDWLGLSEVELPAPAATDWVSRPDCGGVVCFLGTARDHSDGRPGVVALEYEAYEDQVVPRLGRVADQARARWDDLGRVALLHRVGSLGVGDVAVVVAVSAPHRDAAFEAARFCIDTLKATVPIWKKETWSEGSSWGLEPQHLVEPEEAGAVTALIVILLVVGVGVAYVAYRNRPEHTIESGISSFRREMRALAPPDRRRPEPGAPHEDDPDRPDDGMR